MAFLEGLPEEMRQEILQNEGLRNQNLGVLAPQAVAQQPQREAEAMDVASIIAMTNDPALRSEMLLGLDEATLNTLPPNLRAEATRAREAFQRAHQRQREVVRNLAARNVPGGVFR